HELSGMYNSAHGATLTAVWGSWARFVYKNRPDRFATFGSDLFNLPLTGNANQDALRAIEKTEEFFQLIDLPVNIKELVGTQSEEQIKELSYKCTFGETRTIGSFMKLGLKEIKEIYQLANAK
ncbi:MAG: iron-containing alcohol dehydrogenase, partial [Clostridiales bacterium]|nr:iron-containing alcohol dehydrogenase [Clostridiales bacterium]